MFDEDKTKEELKAELKELRRQLSEAKLKGHILDALMRHVPEGIAARGYSPDPPILCLSRHGKDQIESLFPGNLEKADEFFLKFLSDLEKKILESNATGGEAVRDLEWVPARPDGGRETFLVNSGPVSDSSGMDLGNVYIWRDISKQKHMEEALRQSEDRFRAFMDNSPNTAWMKDEHGRYVYLSASGERSFGIRPVDCIGKTDFELFAPEKARQFRANDLTVLKSCRVLETVEESTEPDGSPCTWWKFKFPFTDAAGKRYVGGIGLDISERRRMEKDLRKTRDELEVRVLNRTEELEKANLELRQIPFRLIAAQEEERKRIGSELHDSMAQTLAALKYWVEMIILLKNTGNREDALDRLEQFVPILQRSIEETRVIYMGLKPTMLEELGIVATLRWCCREFQDLYPAHHVELETAIDEKDIPAPLKTVIFRIAQEGLNNIARHSEAEWVDIRLVRKGHDIELTISDDGIGFDPASVLHKAFARSIGLTGMRERTELMRGTFSIESRPGKGTTIRAGWPLKCDENETLAPLMPEGP